MTAPSCSSPASTARDHGPLPHMGPSDTDHLIETFRTFNHLAEHLRFVLDGVRLPRWLRDLHGRDALLPPYWRAAPSALPIAASLRLSAVRALQGARALRHFCRRDLRRQGLAFHECHESRA